MPDSSYTLRTYGGRVIDASKTTSCLGRYINSPYRTGRQANVKFVDSTAGRRDKPVKCRIEAIKNIKKDDEILVRYSQDRGGWYTGTNRRRR